MKKEVLLFTVILLLSAVSINADENTVLTIKDSKTDAIIKDCFAVLKINEDYYYTTIYNGTLLLELVNKTNSLEITCDIDETAGLDYYAKTSIAKSQNTTLYLFPVSSIRGLIIDKLDNVVKNAELGFDCDENAPKTTDEFGSFKYDLLPVGLCRISAKYNEGVGFLDIETERGDLIKAEIKLNKTIIEPGTGESISFGFIFALILVIALAIAAYFFTKKLKKLEKREEKEEKKMKKLGRELKKTKEHPKRTKDIIATLNKKEKEVIEFLLKHENKATQAKIRNETGIPKTTLARMFIGLEAKKIIKIEKIGKLKKIKLTDWFLGKE